MTMKKFLAAAAITFGSVLATAVPASAHHTTIQCTNRQTATWTIVNSEADKALTFTTDREHTGSIPAGGSTTVQYAGFSLTVAAKWSNGQTATNVGSGNCMPDQPTTTTEAPPSTSTPITSTPTSSSTESPTTSVPKTSTTATAPTTAPPSTTSTVAMPNTVNTTVTPLPVVEIITPPVPPCTDPQLAEDGTAVPCGYWSDVTPTAPPTPKLATLPETGNQHTAGFALLGAGLLILGGVLRRMVRRAS